MGWVGDIQIAWLEHYAAPKSVRTAWWALPRCCWFALLRKLWGFFSYLSHSCVQPSGAACKRWGNRNPCCCCKHTSLQPCIWGFPAAPLKTFYCVLCCCLQKWKGRRGVWKAWLVLVFLCFFLAYWLVANDYWLLGTRTLGFNQILQVLNTSDALLSKVWLKWTVP